MSRSPFSVVIPTLQRSDLLPGLLDTYAAHPAVGEVLVVNNAEAPVRHPSPKVRVLQQEANIFVNPAWNLGACEARFARLLISNDDLAFGPEVIDAYDRFVTPRVGMLGPHLGCFEKTATGRPWVFPVYRRPFGFGTLMGLLTDHWVPIPDELKILCGDDYVFHRQTRRNYILRSARLHSPMSVTSAREEFTGQAELDWQAWERRYVGTSPYRDRFAREGLVVERVRTTARTLRHTLSRALTPHNETS